MQDTTRTSPALLESLRTNRRIIGALLVREILTRFGRHNLGFLWLFLEPMMFTLAVTALWTSTRSLHGSDLPIVAFALTGYSSVLLWRNMPGRCIGALGANLSLMYHRNIKVLDIYFARLLLEFGGATISLTVLALTFIAVGILEPPEDILTVAGGWMMLAWFGAGLAVSLGAMAHHSELVDKFWHPASYIMFPLSGAAFLVSALPTFAQEIVLLLPMVHGVEMVRDGWFGDRAKAIYDPSYMLMFNLILSVAGLMLARWTSKRVVPG